MACPRNFFLRAEWLRAQLRFIVGIPFKIHLVGGLIAAALLQILGLTGSIMAFESEIDSWLHPSLFHVVPLGQVLPPATLAARVAAVMRPDDGSQAIYVLPTKPDNSCVVSLLAAGRMPRQVFVDEYSGRVLGTLRVVRFGMVAHGLHQASGAVMGWTAVILRSSVISGLCLWWPLKRIKIGFEGPARRLCFDLHNSAGFFSSHFLLVFGATGAYLAFESVSVPATYKPTGSKQLPGDPSLDSRAGRDSDLGG